MSYTHKSLREVLEIVREMSGLASFGQVVPAIVGMMGCSFGVFYCVRNLKVSEKKKKNIIKTRPWLSPTTRPIGVGVERHGRYRRRGHRHREDFIHLESRSGSCLFVLTRAFGSKFFPI